MYEMSAPQAPPIILNTSGPQKSGGFPWITMIVLLVIGLGIYFAVKEFGGGILGGGGIFGSLMGAAPVKGMFGVATGLGGGAVGGIGNAVGGLGGGLSSRPENYESY
jgi:hypothetical protein